MLPCPPLRSGGGGRQRRTEGAQRGAQVQIQFRQPRVVRRAGGGAPVEAAVCRVDGGIVDARLAAAHQAVEVERPLLVAIGAPKLAGGIVIFVGKACGDVRVVERPHLFYEAVFVLGLPFVREEGDDRCGAAEELRVVAPAAIGCVGRSDARGIARVPCVFGGARLLDCGFARERRDGRAHHRFRSPRRSSRMRVSTVAASDISSKKAPRPRINGHERGSIPTNCIVSGVDRIVLEPLNSTDPRSSIDIEVSDRPRK